MLFVDYCIADSLICTTTSFSSLLLSGNSLNGCSSSQMQFVVAKVHISDEKVRYANRLANNGLMAVALTNNGIQPVCTAHSHYYVHRIGNSAPMHIQTAINFNPYAPYTHFLKLLECVRSLLRNFLVFCLHI